MNRFFNKKAKDASDEHPGSLASSGTKKVKKGKKGQPEQAPQLDLMTALPSTDDFRTSLIMPNLSARFSMLREQDDPKSKLGKASDDSVLSSDRQSRLYDFGFKSSALADIEEVSSINGSIRPPFLRERQGSMETFRTGSDETEGGSMMSRARPGEGNVLFGGRQKVYKISGTGSNRGRALYEDDVSMSSFQRLRQEEKEKKWEQELAQQNRDDTFASLSGYNANRETSSSTTSGPSNTRTSTAATSIASQGANSVPVASPPFSPQSGPGVERTVTKTRRLYEHGLDHHIQEQQTSQLNRLNTVQRQRGGTGSGTSSPTLLSQTRSATHLNDRFNRPNDPMRNISPPPMSHPNFPGSSLKDSQSNASSPVLGVSQSPPVSPVRSDFDELSNAINPNDRGKATALGAFNKPKAFDEQQYLQRQMHLQQGRETPPLRREDVDSGSEGHLSRSGSEHVQKSAPEPVAAPPEPKAAPTAFSVFQRAANQIKLASASEAPAKNSPESYRNRANSGDSADSNVPRSSPPRSEPERRPVISRQASATANLVAPPLHEHPALRSQRSEQDLRTQEESDRVTELTSAPSSAPNAEAGNKSPNAQDLDSPTLGPNGGGLSGLVRQHLRNVSTVSSNYSDAMPPSPGPYSHPSSQLNRGPGHSDTDTTAHSSHGHSNPWDLEDFDRTDYPENESRSSVGAAEGAPGQTTTTGSGPNGTLTLQEMEARALTIHQEAETRRAAWELEMMTKHARKPSAEERDAFQRELAIRQRAIAEKMRSHQVEEDAQSQSSARKALGMLRNKSSRESMASNCRQDPPNKLKMRGFGGSSTSVNRLPRDPRTSEDDRSGQRSRGSSRSRPRFGGQRDNQSYTDAGRESSTEGNRPPHGYSPPTSHPASVRNRSSSDISGGRSRSRPAKQRDEAENSLKEEASSSRTTPEAVPESRESDRSRSNSKSTGNSQYSEHSLHPIQTGLQGRFSPAPSPGVGNHPSAFPPSPRPSPNTQNSPMFLQRPIPAGYTPSSTPPISASNTPTSAAFGQNRQMPRRRTVNKNDISEPVLVSSTSVQETVDLPPGASLKNGMESTPPLPPMNPRRRFGFGRSNPSSPMQSPPSGSPTTENSSPFLQPQSYSGGDDAEKLRKHRQRLRKTSSDNQGLHNKAQSQMPPVASPPLPQSFASPNQSPPRQAVTGGMF